MMKRFLMALAMCLGLGAGLAETVVTVGGDGADYAKLSDALNAADVTAIRLTGTPDEEDRAIVTIPEGRTVVLDLNGQTATLRINNRGTFTVRDTSADAAGVLQSNASGVECLNNYGTFTLESGTLTSAHEAAYATLALREKSRTFITGGKVLTSSGDWCIYHDKGYLNITGGQVGDGVTGRGIAVINSIDMIDISGTDPVSISSASTAVSINGVGCLLVRNPNAVISGGTYGLDISCVAYVAGTVPVDPSANLAAGSTASGSGPSVVTSALAEESTTVDWFADGSGDKAVSVDEPIVCDALTIYGTGGTVRPTGSASIASSYTTICCDTDFSQVTGPISLGELFVAKGVRVTLGDNVTFTSVRARGLLCRADDTSDDPLLTVGPVESGALYASVADAMSAAGSVVCRIKLSGDPEDSDDAILTVSAAQNVTFDLNGQTLNARIHVYGRLALEDTSADQAGVVQSSRGEDSVIICQESGSLVLRGGTVRATADNAYATIVCNEKTKMDMSGGTLVTTGDWCIFNYGDVFISGGQLTSTANGGALRTLSSGVTQIGGVGEVTIDVKGAALSSDGRVYVCNPQAAVTGSLAAGDVEIVLLAGTYSAYNASHWVPAGYVISDGVVSRDPNADSAWRVFREDADRVSDGVTDYGNVLVDDGVVVRLAVGSTYTRCGLRGSIHAISPETDGILVTVGPEETEADYLSVTEALEAVGTDRVEIRLLGAASDGTETVFTIPAGKDVVLNLNGQTLAGRVQNYGSFTLCDLSDSGEGVLLCEMSNAVGVMSYEGGTFELRDATIKMTSASGWSAVESYGTFRATGGTISVVGDYNLRNGGQAFISGLTLESSDSGLGFINAGDAARTIVEAGDPVVIRMQSGASLVFNGAATLALEKGASLVVDGAFDTALLSRITVVDTEHHRLLRTVTASETSSSGTATTLSVIHNGFLLIVR